MLKGIKNIYFLEKGRKGQRRENESKEGRGDDREIKQKIRVNEGGAMNLKENLKGVEFRGRREREKYPN